MKIWYNDAVQDQTPAQTTELQTKQKTGQLKFRNFMQEI
jgi:hypothetical protein